MQRWHGATRRGWTWTRLRTISCPWPSRWTSCTASCRHHPPPSRPAGARPPRSRARSSRLITRRGPPPPQRPVLRTSRPRTWRPPTAGTGTPGPWERPVQHPGTPCWSPTRDIFSIGDVAPAFVKGGHNVDHRTHRAPRLRLDRNRGKAPKASMVRPSRLLRPVRAVVPTHTPRVWQCHGTHVNTAKAGKTSSPPQSIYLQVLSSA